MTDWIDIAVFRPANANDLERAIPRASGRLRQYDDSPQRMVRVLHGKSIADDEARHRVVDNLLAKGWLRDGGEDAFEVQVVQTGDVVGLTVEILVPASGRRSRPTKASQQGLLR